MMRLVVAMLLICLSGLAHTAEKIYFKLPYIVEPNDTLISVFKRFAYSDRNIDEKHPAYKRTVKENPQILDWIKLESGQHFDLFIKIADMDKDKYQAYLEYTQKNPAKVSKGPEGWKANMFYMASYGRFTQSNPQAAEIEFFQNSPVSLGSGLSYYPVGSRWSMASSAYFSYLLASGNNLDGSDISIPPEVGATLYGEYKFVERNFTGYFGVDYEAFSTFDMRAIQEERKVVVERNTVLYATVGVARSLELFSSPFFTKLSFSKSIVSDGGYEGYKTMWYLNKKIAPSWFIHSLFKYHWMDGPSELTTLRLGVGFGYIFF